MKKRIFKMLIAVCMVFTMISTTAFARSGDTPVGVSNAGDNVTIDSGISAACPHTEHDDTCGYIKAIEGAACSHLNEDGIYSCAPVSDVSGNEVSPSHAYVCIHEDDCGFTKSVTGSPCIHKCELCSTQGVPPVGPDSILPPIKECDCTVKCTAEDIEDMDTTTGTAVTIKPDCPVCGEEGADLMQCKGKAPALLKAPRTSETVYTNLGAAGNEENITATLDNGTLTITGSGAMRDWKMPGVLGSDGQTAPWSDQRSSITTVVISEDITTIGHYAFYNCDNLSTVTIPANVTMLGESVLRYCTSLTTIKFEPDSNLTSIGNNAFDGCTLLSEIVLPVGIREIDSNTFADCTALETINIPEGVEAIRGFAFAGCSSLTEITFPESTISLMHYSIFGGCTSLKKVTFKGMTAPYIIDDTFAGIPDNFKIHVPKGSIGYTDDTASDQWKALKDKIAKEVTITFNANGGSVSPATAQTGADGKLAALPTPTHSGSYHFDGWFTAASGGTAVTTATVFEADSTIYVRWTYTGGVTPSPSGGGSSSGGNNNSNVVATPPAPDKPNDPTQAEIKIDTKVDDKGNATVSVTDKNITDAIEKGVGEAKKNGNEANGITLVLRADTGNKTVNTVTVNLSKTVQDKIISNKVVRTIVVVDNPNIRIGMDLKAITEINNQAQADVSITATRLDSGKLTGKAKTAIGTRPVFDLGVSYGGKSVSSFGAGSVTVSIPYTLQAGEKAGNVYGVYVDGDGKAQWITDSSYDAAAKVLRFSTNHFSAYGVGYKQDAPTFTDIASHPAKSDIEFVVARGLLSGIEDSVHNSNTTFSPNTAMTRGMFVTALGRMAKIDTNNYKSGSFTDVKADAYYAPYVNWAASKGITTGTTATTFAPDQTVTRQEMAVFMANYAKTMGYTVPKTRTAVTFADNASIGSWAADAVKSMQMAGVIMGKDGNLYDPTGTATRGEVSAVLHRYVELVIDRATAQGLDVNDSGKIVYYENGKLFTGTKTIDGTTYHFGNDGICTKIDAVAP